MNDFWLGTVIGLGITLIYVFEIWYFSVRHWDKYGLITQDKSKASKEKKQ